MIDKLKISAWIIGIGFIVAAFCSYGLWFWISKNSWVSTSWDIKGTYTHCLDFKFRQAAIGGSIITKFVPHQLLSKVRLHSNGHGMILAASTFEQEFFRESWLQSDEPARSNKLAQIDELRVFKRISIFEGYPIFNHIPDMEFKDQDGNLIGTVSFTLWPDKITTFVNRMVANFKSTRDISIEQKEFMRSVKKTKDERCLVD